VSSGPLPLTPGAVGRPACERPSGTENSGRDAVFMDEPAQHVASADVGRPLMQRRSGRMTFGRPEHQSSMGVSPSCSAGRRFEGPDHASGREEERGVDVIAHGPGGRRLEMQVTRAERGLWKQLHAEGDVEGSLTTTDEAAEALWLAADDKGTTADPHFSSCLTQQMSDSSRSIRSSSDSVSFEAGAGNGVWPGVACSPDRGEDLPPRHPCATTKVLAKDGTGSSFEPLLRSPTPDHAPRRPAPRPSSL